MQVRFKCPACKGTHIADIPETTIYLTCSRSHKPLQLRLTAGGDVKSKVVGDNGDEDMEETDDD
jgi:hypothetical protein